MQLRGRRAPPRQGLANISARSDRLPRSPKSGRAAATASTLTSDPKKKYVNIRELFIHSTRAPTGWCTSPQPPAVVHRVRMMEDFLLVAWKDGAVLGLNPEAAYLVRWDRMTKTQNDLDSGRLICLIGVAPTKPPEFAIFRIGQWPLDSQLLIGRRASRVKDRMVLGVTNPFQLLGNVLEDFLIVSNTARVSCIPYLRNTRTVCGRDSVSFQSMDAGAVFTRRPGFRRLIELAHASTGRTFRGATY